MQIVWLKTALRNLDEIAAYIAQDNPIAASHLLQVISEQVSLLSKQPALGRSGRVLGTRELVISNMHYLVPYRIKNNSVEILRVFHTSRKPPTSW
ncbi:MAG: type II toxin-antitoxin system RelE/ParE family toxin [Methylotenera sp.]|jgi:addiction module RelE/StbE family toxin|nr:type II toxin-antitoxin system RelE/ParE family toxin [Methylotenera sp.]